MSKEVSMGFLPDKEIQDSSKEDYVLGGNGKEIKGIADKVAGLGAALYAWPVPKKGIYPRIMNRINHASLLINKVCQKFLPEGVVQRGKQDWMTCTSNSPCNDLEIQHNYALGMGLFSAELVQWFKDEGYINPDNGLFEIADAYSAIGSGTSRSGNSLKAPVEFIRKNGIVPRSRMLDNKSMNWSAYHKKSRLTKELLTLGQEYLKRVEINYEKVKGKNFSKFTGKIKWEDFDSYVDHTDGDFIKRLAANYNLMHYAYHITINPVPQSKKKEEKEGEEKMKLYKERGNPKVYQRGQGDGLYHHLVNEPVFRDLYGNFQSVEIIELESIPESLIGFTIYNKESFIDLISNLLKGLKGKNYMSIQKSITRKAPRLASSVDPQKVALSIKGAIIASAALIIGGFGMFGIDIQVGELKSLASSIPNIVDAALALCGLLMGFYGGIRKIINRNSKR